ncbi:DUF1801 domain-containing protein [Saccharicrinis sp. FJH54]|uniref:DUF1801 domain-containing protein n=1 Tax=Saccharicrinis sp. FJH54 TaxID=3344665 RepID=UPI0035D44982
MNGLNNEVTGFLNTLDHPLREEIERLRGVILDVEEALTENVKWNGPNYCCGGADRITMRIHPPKQIQLIFHRGAKKQEQPKERLIPNAGSLFVWKENDRAVITFKTMQDIDNNKEELRRLVVEWIKVTK